MIVVYTYLLHCCLHTRNRIVNSIILSSNPITSNLEEECEKTIECNQVSVGVSKYINGRSWLTR